MRAPDPLTLAVRVFPVPEGQIEKRTHSSLKHWRRPRAMLVFDTETRIDAAQALTFGSYRFYEDGRCLEEGLFYGDDLSDAARAELLQYAKGHVPDVEGQDAFPALKCLTRTQFLDRLYAAVYDGRALLVGFNLPFDLSRIASSAGAARRRYHGGFSLLLWEYIDAQGRRRENRHRPRVVVKHIDSKRSLIAFTSAKDPDQDDLIPDGSQTGAPETDYAFRGHFLDLRTLAFALTDRGHSLESACTAFNVEHGKVQAAKHGDIDSTYIDYNRRDVQATAELAFKLLAEYDQHPISLQETKAYSPASIGKAYLRAMGIRPILERQPKFPKRYLGYAQSAFYGGRTSAHIRKVAVPVVYVDFLSMYTTVNALMDLWAYVVAKRISVIRLPLTDVRGLVDSVTLETCFLPQTWKKLQVYVRIIADGDVLPSRATYNQSTNDLQVAVNNLYTQSNRRADGLWYALPDIVASKLISGKTPRIVEAFSIGAEGQLPGLKPTRLRGRLEVDPGARDFFRTVIEERKRPKTNDDMPDSERQTQDLFLKVLASATGYGIFAQMDRRESNTREPVTCFGINPEFYRCSVAHLEEPGTYCFPPLASLITSAARMMLTLLERCVTDLGGTYAMEDTDSMAVVASRRGGMVPCTGGQHRSCDKLEAVRALSWVQIDQIVDRFKALSPYHAAAIPGSILKIEDDNFDPKTRKQRQLWCLAISAKRYALFLRSRDGEPKLLQKGKNNDKDRWSEHGLGHLLNPTNLRADSRHWIGLSWLNIIRRSLRLRPKPLQFERRIAVGRISVSSPGVLRRLCGLNAEDKYSTQIKPFNFILSCHVRTLGHPLDADSQHFQLIVPYEKDPRKWAKLPWMDQYTGKRYDASTSGAHGTRAAARVKTYGDVLREYEHHAESKCADAKGKPSDKQTIGLLSRRHVTIGGLRFIGKESNRLEEFQRGMPRLDDKPYIDYPDPRRDEWATVILPTLKSMPLTELLRQTGLSRATLQAIRAGRIPHQTNKELLLPIAKARATSRKLRLQLD